MVVVFVDVVDVDVVAVGQIVWIWALYSVYKK